MKLLTSLSCTLYLSIVILTVVDIAAGLVCYKYECWGDRHCDGFTTASEDDLRNKFPIRCDDRAEACYHIRGSAEVEGGHRESKIQFEKRGCWVAGEEAEDFSPVQSFYAALSRTASSDDKCEQINGIQQMSKQGAFSSRPSDASVRTIYDAVVCSCSGSLCNGNEHPNGANVKMASSIIFLAVIGIITWTWFVSMK